MKGINGDTIVLNNQSYSVEDLHKLPHDLHPSNLSKKENDQWLIFGGILSQYNCASELIATSGKSLAEAGKSPIFSTGIQLHHKDIFDTTNWKKNMLGQALMKVRNELVSLI